MQEPLPAPNAIDLDALPDTLPETLPDLAELGVSLPGHPYAWGAVGVVMLLAGRRLFWLMLGAIGFLAGFVLAGQFLEGQSQIVILGVGVLTGLLVAALAVFVQKLAIAIGGFLVGGYTALAFLGPHLTATAASWSLPDWIVFLIGGFLGALLARLVFEWALILLSSVFGALLLFEALPPFGTSAVEALAFLGVVAVGVLVQLGAGRRGRRRRE